MNEMKLFENPEFGAIRTVEVGGEPWLVGKDVAQALGYSDTSDALKRHVDPEDKLTRRFADSGQSREMYIILESWQSSSSRMGWTLGRTDSLTGCGTTDI